MDAQIATAFSVTHVDSSVTVLTLSTKMFTCAKRVSTFGRDVTRAGKTRTSWRGMCYGYFFVRVRVRARGMSTVTSRVGARRRGAGARARAGGRAGARACVLCVRASFEAWTR